MPSPQQAEVINLVQDEPESLQWGNAPMRMPKGPGPSLLPLSSQQPPQYHNAPQYQYEQHWKMTPPRKAPPRVTLIHQPSVPNVQSASKHSQLRHSAPSSSSSSATMLPQHPLGFSSPSSPAQQPEAVPPYMQQQIPSQSTSSIISQTQALYSQQSQPQPQPQPPQQQQHYSPPQQQPQPTYAQPQQKRPSNLPGYLPMQQPPMELGTQTQPAHQGFTQHHTINNTFQGFNVGLPKKKRAKSNASDYALEPNTQQLFDTKQPQQLQQPESSASGFAG